jgi:hypothetical protein
LYSPSIKTFLTSSWLKLRELDLSYNYIDNNGIKLLTKINMPNLNKLNLRTFHKIYIDYCEIHNEGIKHLSKANLKYLKNL